MPPEPAAGALFDARRLYYAKPALRGWLHAVWFGASLVAGPLLVARGHGHLPVRRDTTHHGTNRQLARP